MPYPNDPNSTNGLTSDPQRSGTQSTAEDTVRDDARKVADTARKDLDEVTQEAKAQAGALAEQAKAQFDDAAQKAKGLAEEQKDLVAGQIGGVAEAMKKVAGELEESNASSASYARMIADGANRISDTIKNNDVDAIMHMAQDFGRKQPAAFVGAAALLGFAASRFLMASAKREENRTSTAETGTRVDYNGLPKDSEPQRGYGASSGSDYSSTGRV
jgi:hypothetical protein